LPVCTDSCQVSSIARAAEERLQQSAVFVPTLWIGSSHHHLDFPGTLSVRPSLYSRVIQELATSILSAGFRRLFFLNGHGGNETPTAQALTELASMDSAAREAHLVMSSWWSVGRPDAKNLGLQTDAVSHACEYETSLMLRLRPDLVKIDKIKDAPPMPAQEWMTGEKQVGIYRRFALMTAHGNLGTSSAASAEKGGRIFDAVVNDVVAFVESFAEWPLPKPLGPKR
jgi:creatinine amidohydrolase